MPLLPRFQLDETTSRRVFFSTGIAAWFAAIAVLVLAVAMIFQRPARPVDVIATINDYVDASTWARDYMLVWLGGDASQADKLASMTALPAARDLSTDPFTVLDVRIHTGILRTESVDGPEVEWAMTLSPVVVSPGTGGAAVRSYYRLTFLQAGSTYKALMYPRPVNSTSQPVQIQSHYSMGVDLGGPLASSVREFMTAFYAAGNDGALGRFVSPEFTEEPITGSLYNSIELTDIMAGAGSVEPANAEPGDTISVLANAKASASLDTYSLISAPLRLTLSPNRQWLVDGFDEPVRFGAVSYQ